MSGTDHRHARRNIRVRVQPVLQRFIAAEMLSVELPSAWLPLLGQRRHRFRGVAHLASETARHGRLTGPETHHLGGQAVVQNIPKDPRQPPTSLLPTHQALLPSFSMPQPSCSTDCLRQKKKKKPDFLSNPQASPAGSDWACLTGCVARCSASNPGFVMFGQPVGCHYGCWSRQRPNP